MSRFLAEKFSKMQPYTPGEQPQDRRYIKLNTNESPFPPAPAVIAAISRDEAGRLNLYSDPTAGALVSAIAKRYDAESRRKGGGAITEKNVFVGNGSDEVLAFAFQAFCADGVVFPRIGYGFYPVFAELYGIDVTEVGMNEDLSVKYEEFAGVNKTIVLANPNAQTGVYLPLSVIETLLSENKDRLLILDEAYCDFGGESAVRLIDKYDNLIVVQTMSKSRQLAGGRIGFAIACEQLICDLNKMKYSFNPYNLNRLSILAGVAAVGDEDYFRRTTAAIAGERTALKKSLNEMGFWVSDSLANFVLAKHSGIGGEDLYLALKEKGVLVRYLGGELKDYVRITIGSRDQNAALLKAIAAVLEEKGI